MTDFSISDSGAVEGYGAYFGNTDSHGDVIDRGAFSDSLADWNRKGRMPPMLLQHAMGEGLMDGLPIGVWTDMGEDGNGLYVRGKLAIGNSRADDSRALMRMTPPALSGASIGYIARKFSVFPKNSSGLKRKLHRVDLREVSLVGDPSNDLARVRAKSRYMPSGGDPVIAALQRLKEELAGR
jgi:uncharacterized protein